jgi:hypothetical protein
MHATVEQDASEQSYSTHLPQSAARGATGPGDTYIYGPAAVAMQFGVVRIIYSEANSRLIKRVTGCPVSKKLASCQFVWDANHGHMPGN